MELFKGAKKEERTHKSGFTYKYSEGPVTFPEIIAFWISSGEREDNIVLAVLAPIPETEINFLKRFLSILSKNPKSVCESSLTCKWV